MPFLPISKQEMLEQGIDQLDFICVTGDSYVDHPSFGIAIVSRVIESIGRETGHSGDDRQSLHGAQRRTATTPAPLLPTASWRAGWE